MWYAADGHTIQVERKQIDEVLGGMDRVEEQLRREIETADENILLIEGMFEPIFSISSACQSLKRSKNGKVIVANRQYNCSYTGVQAWLSQLDKCGITIVQTIDYTATAFTLVALFNSSQKMEHTTLKRYIKKKLFVEGYNPHVVTLMGIKGAQIGETKAKSLIERYGTVWQVLNQDVNELAETKNVGKASARKLLNAIGRGTDG